MKSFIDFLFAPPMAIHALYQNYSPNDNPDSIFYPFKILLLLLLTTFTLTVTVAIATFFLTLAIEKKTTRTLQNYAIGKSYEDILELAATSERWSTRLSTVRLISGVTYSSRPRDLSANLPNTSGEDRTQISGTLTALLKLTIKVIGFCAALLSWIISSPLGLYLAGAVLWIQYHNSEVVNKLQELLSDSNIEPGAILAVIGTIIAVLAFSFNHGISLRMRARNSVRKKIAIDHEQIRTQIDRYIPELIESIDELAIEFIKKYPAFLIHHLNYFTHGIVSHFPNGTFTIDQSVENFDSSSIESEKCSDETIKATAQSYWNRQSWSNDNEKRYIEAIIKARSPLFDSSTAMATRVFVALENLGNDYSISGPFDHYPTKEQLQLIRSTPYAERPLIRALTYGRFDIPVDATRQRAGLRLISVHKQCALTLSDLKYSLPQEVMDACALLPGDGIDHMEDRDSTDRKDQINKLWSNAAQRLSIVYKREIEDAHEAIWKLAIFRARIVNSYDHRNTRSGLRGMVRSVLERSAS